MATLNVTAKPTAIQTLRSKLADYYTLTKPEVNLLILMTTSTGYYLASSEPMRIWGLVNTLVGTLLVASGTATLNQWMERVWDGQMRRTASRPLPSGRLTGHEALVFVYRILFCLYAEARGGELGVLPINDDVYRLGYSLEALRDLADSGEMRSPR